jgi:hypothetical protein
MSDCHGEAGNGQKRAAMRFREKSALVRRRDTIVADVRCVQQIIRHSGNVHGIH